jgi:hypothetical protein
MCAGGALCGFSSFVLVVCALCLSFVFSRMLRAVALAKGVRDLSSSSDLALCLCSSFDRLLEFLFVRLFSFSFLFCYFRVGVVNALIKGEIEDHVWFEDWWMVASLCDE